MAIPSGTTARQLGAIIRWMLVTLITMGMLLWWWPGYRNWGALSAGLLAAYCLWLMWRVVASDRTVPGHPFHLVLAFPVAAFTCHFLAASVVESSSGPMALNGAIDLSIIFQLSLLAVTVMLIQNLMPHAANHMWVLTLCGGAMMGGSAAAIIWGGAPQVRETLTLLGFAGVAVWLSPMWHVAVVNFAGARPRPLVRRELRIACVGAAVIAAALFQRFSLRATLLAGAIMGAALILGGIIYAGRRKTLLVWGGFLASVSLLIARCYGSTWSFPNMHNVSMLGNGEVALNTLSSSDSTLTVLLGMIGWAGATWMAGGMVVCAVWLMWHSRTRHPAHQVRAIVWVVATALASCSLLSAGGLFIPAVTLAAALTWGMLPAMVNRPSYRRPGALLLLPIILLMALMGIATRPGLAQWSLAAYQLSDKFLHCLVGMVLASTLAWLMGTRRWWLGLVGIAVAAAAGGAGEAMQFLADTGRGVEFGDWLAHAVGSAVIAAPYLLCVASRWCESSEVTAESARAGKPDPYRH
ncbi:MAG: hypothetical protein J7M14_07395 [Planctomycetes bacterium]|nr:hypothetical protein [Planctomycetota bacterium]